MIYRAQDGKMMCSHANSLTLSLAVIPQCQCARWHRMRLDAAQEQAAAAAARASSWPGPMIQMRISPDMAGMPAGMMQMLMSAPQQRAGPEPGAIGDHTCAACDSATAGLRYVSPYSAPIYPHTLLKAQTDKPRQCSSLIGLHFSDLERLI